MGNHFCSMKLQPVFNKERYYEFPNTKDGKVAFLYYFLLGSLLFSERESKIRKKPITSLFYKVFSDCCVPFVLHSMILDPKGQNTWSNITDQLGCLQMNLNKLISLISSFASFLMKDVHLLCEKRNILLSKVYFFPSGKEHLKHSYSSMYNEEKTVREKEIKCSLMCFMRYSS